MVNATLISNTGGTRTLSIKTGWSDITVSEYIDMQGKPDTEVIAMLTGLNASEQLALDDHTSLFLAELIGSLQELPIYDCSLNIETETIGQYETAKSFLQRLHKQKPDTYQVEVLPILYGLYKAEKVNGNWNNAACMDLVEKAKQMPVLEVIPFALHIMREINRVAERERQINEDDESDPDAEESGANQLKAFGFYPTLNLLAGGDILKQEEVMQLSVLKVHTHLRFMKTTAEIQRNMNEIKRENTAA